MEDSVYLHLWGGSSARDIEGVKDHNLCILWRPDPSSNHQLTNDNKNSNQSVNASLSVSQVYETTALHVSAQDEKHRALLGHITIPIMLQLFEDTDFH